jgi:peptide methionine sulfoxide reductase msrA/msrB
MNWNDIKLMARNNPPPPRRVEKTEQEWKQLLTPEQFRVTRQHGTEVPFSGEYCESYTPGIYACLCCGTELFDSSGKFNSYTGWPSFTEPVNNEVVKYMVDKSFGMDRVEALCNVCDAHLGHVFPDGPPPSKLRFCINSVSLKMKPTIAETISKDDRPIEMATLGGGCFWCLETIMKELEGVEEVLSGYAGGVTDNPTYYQVTTGNTGHAEVVQVRFNPERITYDELLRVFFSMHDATSLNRQGADVGTQYRSIILYHHGQQRDTAEKIIGEMKSHFSEPIVTEISPYTKFFKAEQSHQDFYRNNPEHAYCQVVINPKLRKLRAELGKKLTTGIVDVG